MTETVKVCKIHGNLTFDKCSQELNRHKRYVFRCKKCRVISAVKSTRKCGKRVLIAHREYRAKNLDSQREYFRKLRENMRLTLARDYVRDQIVKRSTLRVGNIPEWMIDVKRTQLALKRYIKQQNHR